MDRTPVLENPLALALMDAHPVTVGHLLVIPRRHASDYFDLGTAEVDAYQNLLTALVRSRSTKIRASRVSMSASTAALLLARRSCTATSFHAVQAIARIHEGGCEG